MRYTFSNRLKIGSFIAMALGLIMLIAGFMNAPSSVEEAKEMMAAAHGDGHGGHGTSHATVEDHMGTDGEHHVGASGHQDKTSEESNTHTTEVVGEHSGHPETEESHGEGIVPDAEAKVHQKEGNHSVEEGDVHNTPEHHERMDEEHHGTEDSAVQHSGVSSDGHGGHGGESHGHGHSAAHDEHVFHQLSNRPWAALYVAAFFFFMISLGVLAFYAINRAAQAGWSPLLFRIMEGITAFIVPGGIIVFVILLLSSLHLNHMFVWMDAEVVEHDHLLQGKKGYLNPTFFLIRAAIFLGGWIGYRQISKKISLAQDKSDDNSNFKKNFRLAAAFLVFYLVTESMMSWDWLMSLDPHWFSTLFGWYVFASMFVSGITTIAMVVIYLKSKGLLQEVNDSHVHDLAKFMFGISVFWTYLWFSQFMLIWYANIPEEVTYFVFRIEHYKMPFFGMLALNFIFPLLVLMNSDYKRVNWFVIMTGIVILFGHYLDIFNMVMPATVGENWYIGVPEIGGILFFGGLFTYWTFNALAKEELVPKRHPFLEESRQFHY